MKRILLVEDEPHLRIIYRSALEHGGFHVVEAGDGSEALHYLLQPEAPGAYASPPCLMHELDPEWTGVPAPERREPR